MCSDGIPELGHACSGDAALKFTHFLGAWPVQGLLLHRLHPPVTTEEARCLLALLAAQPVGSRTCANGITLPALKAALAAVQEAQQFPASEGLHTHVSCT